VKPSLRRSAAFALAAASTLAACVRTPRGPAVPPPPPEVQREFRGVWVATVGNIDWPSRPGLSTAEQQRELVAILDRARALNLNAVVLQVRPATDALYASSLEPWSEYLTGTMGRAPSPYYDPLAFAITEAHRRGLELHAWFNPYRARQSGAKSPVATTHVSVTKPELVRRYGPMQWMDPGEPATMAHSLAVVTDVVRRYDVDGVHIDDYFYPYKITDSAGRKVDFPDSVSYARYVANGGTLARDDWRRRNVDQFVQRMFEQVRAIKPTVRVGVSPFGIARPGQPAGVCCFDQYTELYADARKWLREGWLDYWTPQLYWRISAPQQSYPRLLAYWAEENVRGRHLWPGNYLGRVADASKTPWPVAEIDSQIAITRAQPGATGNVHFSMKALMTNQGGVADSLGAGAYARPALVPATPWLPGRAPGRPSVAIVGGSAPAALLAPAVGEQAPWLWAVRVRTGTTWHTAVLPGSQTRWTPPAGGAPDEVLVFAVDRTGREGPTARAAATPPIAIR
jgi:uncharacterized lipoprotein YddW (UPF0748 family)